MALLATTTAWLFFDGGSRKAFEIVLTEFGVHDVEAARVVRDPSRQGAAVAALRGAFVLAGCTQLAMLLGLFLGPRRLRSLAAWLVFTAVACGWLTVVAAWPGIYWQGQRRRVAPSLASLETWAQRLDANWPRDDGQWRDLGTFMAYPKGTPRTLILLSEGRIPNSSLRISAIERPRNKEIYFELTGAEHGAWLVWSPERVPERQFIGGLGTAYRRSKISRVAADWFLAQYDAVPSLPTPRSNRP